MRRLVMYFAMTTLVMAKPEIYREKEDFQYSRSSTDEGTKSGYYDAQRGNMGGNYERAHNMDTLAQHQMGGLVSQVEGELGDASKTRTGSVFTASNSRGVYGSGHYDLSNLEGRNFQEGVSYGHSQALSSSNSAFNNDARYRSNGRLSNSDYVRHQSNLDAQNSYGTNQFVQESQSGRTSKHYTQSAYEGRNSYVQGNTDEAANDFGSSTHNRLISTVPVKVIVRPGQRIAVPIATQTHSGTQGTTFYDQSIANQQALDTISRSNSHYTAHSDQNAINTDAEVLNVGSHQGTFKPSSNGKQYESSYSYHKQWEKHDTKPSLVLPTLNPIPVNSELYDDSLTKYDSQHNDNRYRQNLSQNSASSQMYQSALSRQQQSASSLNSNYVAHNQGIKSGLHFDAANLASNSKPQSYQSSYAYHKSWERQGEPYIIKPATNGVYEGQTAEKLTDAASSYNHDSSITTNNQQDFSYKCLVACEPRHTRVARSHGSNAAQMEQQSENMSDLGQQTQQIEDFGQQTRQLEDFGQQTQQLNSFGQQSQNVDDFGQQTQQLESFGQSQNLEDFGQQTQQLESFGQHSQNLEYIGQQTQQLESFGQQSQNLEDFGQQTQQLESFGQQSQNLEDLGQHTQQLESFGQQSQNSEDFGQQTQQLESFGQQSQNLEDLGQQTQKLESFGQQQQEDYGQQTQHLHYFHQQLQTISGEKKHNATTGQKDEYINQMTLNLPREHDSVFITQNQDSSSSFQKHEQSADMFQSSWEKVKDDKPDYSIATGQAYINQQKTKLSDRDILEHQSTLEKKPDNNQQEIRSLSNLWGKIDNLDGYYEKNIDDRESQRSSDNLREQYAGSDSHNSNQNLQHASSGEKKTEKTIDDTKLTNLDLLSQKSLNETNQHTTNLTTGKQERNLDIGRGDIGPEDHPEIIDQSAEGLSLEKLRTDNSNQMLSQITTDKNILDKLLKNMNETNITSIFINNNKEHKNVDTNQERQFSDQQINIEQETWTFEQQNTDQHITGDVSQQNQNIYDFGQEIVNQDFGQQNVDLAHFNQNDKFQSSPVIGQETKNYFHSDNKNKQIVTETNRTSDMYDETHKVIGLEGINRLNYTVTQDVSTPVPATTESSTFWKSVGNKFKNAKDTIASWF